MRTLTCDNVLIRCFNFDVPQRWLMHSDFRFMRAAQLPDEVEMLLEEHRLSVSAVHALFAALLFT